MLDRFVREVKPHSPYTVLPIPSTNSVLKTVITRIPPSPPPLLVAVDALRIGWLHMFGISGPRRRVRRAALVSIYVLDMPVSAK